MKKRFLGFLLLPLLLTGCGAEPSESVSIDNTSYPTHSAVHPRKTGEIADFNLVGPENGFSTGEGFSFTWEACPNADYYQLEIASTLNF